MGKSYWLYSYCKTSTWNFSHSYTWQCQKCWCLTLLTTAFFLKQFLSLTCDNILVQFSTCYQTIFSQCLCGHFTLLFLKCYYASGFCPLPLILYYKSSWAISDISMTSRTTNTLVISTFINLNTTVSGFIFSTGYYGSITENIKFNMFKYNIYANKLFLVFLILHIRMYLFVHFPNICLIFWKPRLLRVEDYTTSIKVSGTAVREN